ncbi:hypothetical protein K0M31_000006 [Melipona bicolor]|uniref:Uncharacterized protein n=1 Tax=Melipona bicolor TaxID=60889 RepID=A0AA40KWE9_9HYME|nr:hypothetical protein K0M31_000006 [Melipona bicolor]
MELNVRTEAKCVSYPKLDRNRERALHKHTISRGMAYAAFYPRNKRRQVSPVPRVVEIRRLDNRGWNSIEQTARSKEETLEIPFPALLKNRIRRDDLVTRNADGHYERLHYRDCFALNGPNDVRLDQRGFLLIEEKRQRDAFNRVYRSPYRSGHAIRLSGHEIDRFADFYPPILVDRFESIRKKGIRSD